MAKKTSDMNCRWVPAVPGVVALSCLRHSLLNTCGTRCCTLHDRREARYRPAEKHAARPQKNTLQDRKRRRRGYIYFAYPESAKPLGTFSRDQVGKYRRLPRSSRGSASLDGGPADGTLGWTCVLSVYLSASLGASGTLVAKKVGSSCGTSPRRFRCVFHLQSWSAAELSPHGAFTVFLDC